MQITKVYLVFIKEGESIMKKSFQVLTLALIVTFLFCGFAYQTPKALEVPVTTDAEPQKPQNEVKYPVYIIQAGRKELNRTNFEFEVSQYDPKSFTVTIYGPADAMAHQITVGIQLLNCTTNCYQELDTRMPEFASHETSVMGNFNFRHSAENKVKSGDKAKAYFKINYKGKPIEDSVTFTIP